MKLSHKDFILLIGILVAAAIALSTWVNSDSQSKNGVAKPQMKKAATSETTSMVLNHLIEKVKPHSPVIRIQ